MNLRKKKFRYNGPDDLHLLEEWLTFNAVNACSLGDGGRFVQVGYQTFTIGGNPKSYERFGGIITNSSDEAMALFEAMCACKSAAMSFEGLSKQVQP